MKTRNFIPRLLTPRRIFMRPWRQNLGAPLLVGSTVGSLLITYFGSGACARYLGLVPGMITASLLGAVFLLGGDPFFPRRGVFRSGEAPLQAAPFLP